MSRDVAYQEGPPVQCFDVYPLSEGYQEVRLKAGYNIQEPLSSIAITTANVTLSEAQARSDILVLTGVLTGNRDLIIPNGLVKQYKIIMKCTGAYAVTIKTDTTGDDFIVESVKTGAAKTYHCIDVYSDGSNIYGEEYRYTGTFTPVLYGSTTAGTPTYSTQKGEFDIIGNRCMVRLGLVLTSLGSAAGSMRISGIPKTPDNTAAASIYVDNVSFDAGEHAKATISSAGWISLYVETVTGSGAISENDLTDTSTIRVSGSYFF